MNILRNFTYILCFFVCFGAAKANDFTHFKLKHPGLKSEIVHSNKALWAKPQARKSPNITPILEQLERLLGSDYSIIGAEEVEKLMENYDMGGGVYNFSGFSWYRPMINYDIRVNRDVAPELFSDRWIVHDSLILRIDAFTYLNNLREEGIIDIDTANLSAFAGLSFKRVYHYYHFEADYISGLTSDFSKLFLSFRKFKYEKLSTLEPFEVIKQSDHYYFYSGAVVSSPIWNGGSASLDFEYNQAYVNEVQIQNLAEEEKDAPNELIRVSASKKYNKKFSSKLSLQYDFFNLLKLTLLSAQVEYEYAESKSKDFSFFKEDFDIFKENQQLKEEFNSLLKGKNNTEVFQNNIVTTQQRKKQNFNSKYTFLLFGNLKRRATEQINIVSHGISKTFFKHYAESVTYLQNFLSSIFSKVINKIFSFENKVKNISELRKSFNIEHELRTDLPENTVQAKEEFSMEMEVNFLITKTHKWYHYLNRKKAESLVRRYSLVGSRILNKIRKRELIGPISVRSHIEVGKKGLKFFHELPTESIATSILNVCGTSAKHYSTRIKKLLKQVRPGRIRKSSPTKRCIKKLVNRYLDYLEVYERDQLYDLGLLKKFLGAYFSHSSELQDIQKLFGENQIYIHGQLNAWTRNKKPFQTYFSTGQFDGTGVIDHFKHFGTLNY